MAVFVDTVADVKIKPNLSAFTQAEPTEVMTTAYNVLGSLVMSDDLRLLADALLDQFWIVPK